MFGKSELNEMLSLGIKMLKAIDIPISESICPEVLLANSHSFFGQCCPKESTLKCLRPQGYDYYIRISCFTLQNSEKSVMNTILHELIHTCKDTHGHDKQWQAYGRRIHETYGYDIRRQGGDKSAQDIKNLSAGRTRRRSFLQYRLTCSDCGHSWSYTKAGKVVKSYKQCSCPYCKTMSLVLTQYAKPL